MKYILFIISVSFGSIMLAMENNETESSQLKSEITEETMVSTDYNKSYESVLAIKYKLEELEKRKQDQQKQTKFKINEMLQELKDLKLKNKFLEQEVNKTIALNNYPKIFGFNRNYVFFTLGLTSISFIAGYLMGSKSLKFMSPR